MTHKPQVLTVPDPLASPWQTRKLSEKEKGTDEHNFTHQVTFADNWTRRKTKYLLNSDMRPFMFFFFFSEEEEEKEETHYIIFSFYLMATEDLPLMCHKSWKFDRSTTVSNLCQSMT